MKLILENQLPIRFLDYDPLHRSFFRQYVILSVQQCMYVFSTFSSVIEMYLKLFPPAPAISWQHTCAACRSVSHLSCRKWSLCPSLLLLLLPLHCRLFVCRPLLSLFIYISILLCAVCCHLFAINTATFTNILDSFFALSCFAAGFKYFIRLK